MKIVIAGAGEVGIHLARMLSSENLDITLIDTNEKHLLAETRKMEVLPIVGNPTNILDMQESGVGTSDLFVSVLPDEASNIIACMIAKKLGAKQTIARINNHEYIDPANFTMFEDMGVDEMIYPEELAANEILSTIKYPWTRLYVEFFNGSFSMVAVKVREGAPIIGKALSELSNDNEKTYHVVAVKRDLSTIIPNGDTIINHGDLVFFTSLTNNLEIIRKLCGKGNVDVKKVVIIGASPIALRTISKLPKEISVAIIDKNKDKCLSLIDKLPRNISIYHGDGRDQEIIEEVGLNDSQIFIALTENSETNILSCFAAKKYNVFKTIAKEENIDYITLAYRLDIGSLINKKLLTAGYIYRMLWGQHLGSVVCISLVNNAEVAELIIGRKSNLVGKSMKDINLLETITFGGLVRNGVAQMVSGNTVFEPSDHVVVFYHNITMAKLKELFN